MHETGLWWDFGNFCWRCFHALEWTYNNLTPNKIFIILAFGCFFWWMYLQNNYNKKAAKNGTYK